MFRDEDEGSESNTEADIERADSGARGATVANTTVFDYRISHALKKQNTSHRRETVFAGGYNAESGENQEPTLGSKDLKKHDLLKIMELKTVGKSRPYELTGETTDNLMVRFLIHFLYAEHTYTPIELFDSTDSIFKQINNQQQKVQKNQLAQYQSQHHSASKQREGQDSSTQLLGPKDSISQRLMTSNDEF